MGESRDFVAVASEVVAGREEVVFAYLFGSAASGKLKPMGDIDLAVFVADGADGFETRLVVADLVSRRLGGIRVDVVVLNDAPPALAGRVLATGRLILDRNPRGRHLYESLAMREYADFRVLEQRHLTERFGHG